MANVPADLKYTDQHEWVRVDGNTAYLGITDYAQGELGDVVFVELPNANEHFEAMASFGTIEAVKAVSDLYMPVAGTIIESNGALDANPAAVNSDPYGEGWMVRITMDDPSAANGLLNAAEYEALIG